MNIDYQINSEPPITHWDRKEANHDPSCLLATQSFSTGSRIAKWTTSTKRLLAKVSPQLSDKYDTFQHNKPGPARRYNLEKCRKELERSCANYQNRDNRFPPTPRTTPCTNSAPNLHSQHSPQQKNGRFQTSQSLNETAHIPQRIKRCPFQYDEDELRQRSERLRAESKQRLKPLTSTAAPADPLDGYTGHNFSNDDSNNDPSTESFVPRRHPTLHRQNLTHDDIVTIRATAVRIASHCAVRDEQPYPDSPRQETLHRTRPAKRLNRTENKGHRSAEYTRLDEKQDDNGISVTEDGCIIQHGFDISSLASSPADTVYARCDSGCEVRYKTPNHASSNQESHTEPFRPSARNREGARVPVCFRKQEIIHKRNVSDLSALLSGLNNFSGRPEAQGTLQEKLRQAHALQQCQRTPIPARPSVFFSSSTSSGAVVSESEDEDNNEDDEEDEKTICEGGKTDSATTNSAVGADGSKDVASPGSVATLVNSDKLAEIVKTSDRLPQQSAPPSPLSSKRPVLNPPQVEQNRLSHAGTPLPQRASKHPNLVAHLQGQDPGKPSLPQSRNPQPQFLRSQQTCKVLLAHQQHRRAQQPPPPRARSPCQALGLRLPLPPKYGNDNHVSSLLDKTERNGGRRPANFSWDHVAPMHGFSSSRAFYVLD